MCSLSESRVWLGQWLIAHEGGRQPSIMSDADDKNTRDLKAFLLRMLSYLSGHRPKIEEVYGYAISQLYTGASTKKLIS